jgi:hypothetical protein
MQKFVVLIVFLGLLSLPLMAQDNPKVEVFGGWQYLHLGNVYGTSQNVPEGFDGSVTANLNKHFGVTGDFSGSFKSITGQIETGNGLGSGTVHDHIFTYAGGPVISMDAGGKINPFAHFLVGGFHNSLSGSGCLVSDPTQCGSIPTTSTNGMVMMVGGGLDVKASQHVAIRLGQFDWVYYHSNGVGESKNFRYSAGVVFRF